MFIHISQSHWNMSVICDNSFQVKKRSSEEGSTQWTTGIAEVQLPIEYGFMALAL